MEYEEVKRGRSFILKFEHKDNFLDELLSFVKEKQIRAGKIEIIGALKNAKGAVGPQTDELPPTPIIKEINNAHEVVGVGTIFWQDDEPKLHLHCAIGHKDDANVICIRQDTEVFIVIEAILQEYVETTAERKIDEEIKMPLLSFEPLP